MKFADLHFTKDKDFLKLTGIKYSTFSKILAILQEAELKKFYRGGKSNKLPLADRILMTLKYWRQYRTYFHIGKSYGISESNCYQNIKWIKDTLIKNPNFQQLFGQKELVKENFKDKTLIIDVPETAIQRPKKSKTILLRKKEKTYNKNASHNWKRKQTNFNNTFFIWKKARFSFI